MESDRRRLLAAVATALSGSLAGCGGGDDATTPTADSTETAASTPTPEPTATEAMETPTPTQTATPTPAETATPTETTSPVDADQEVLVGPGGFVFEPETFEVSTGSTVLWTWEGGGHNVIPSSTPSDSDWAGTPGGESETYSSGYQYTYTFEVAGTYEYYCSPHRNVGMTGSFVVTD